LIVERMPNTAASGIRPAKGLVGFNAPHGLGVRVDSAVYAGHAVPLNYDLRVGKLSVHGRNRNEALMRLRRALDEFIVDGINMTIPCLKHWFETPTFRMDSTIFIGLRGFSIPAEWMGRTREAFSG
jgi:acetyl/propionyl-CoA carboxylase alpha subunit